MDVDDLLLTLSEKKEDASTSRKQETNKTVWKEEREKSYVRHTAKRNNGHYKKRTILSDILKGNDIEDEVWVSVLDAIIFVVRFMIGMSKVAWLLVILRVALSIALMVHEPVYDGTFDEFLSQLNKMIENKKIDFDLLKKVTKAIMFLIFPYLRTLVSHIFKKKKENDTNTDKAEVKGNGSNESEKNEKDKQEVTDNVNTSKQEDDN